MSTSGHGGYAVVTVSTVARGGRRFKRGHFRRDGTRVVPEPGQSALTVDAIATPLVDGDKVLGSLTFFQPVGY